MRKHNKVKSKDQGPIICDVCGKSFKRKPTMLEHKRVKHGVNGGREFKCDECGKILVSESSLINHTRLHTGK